MTRQRAWQKKMKAEGKCVQCGEPSVTKWHCRVCADKKMAHDMRYARNKLDKRLSKIVVDSPK